MSETTTTTAYTVQENNGGWQVLGDGVFVCQCHDEVTAKIVASALDAWARRLAGGAS